MFQEQKYYKIRFKKYLGVPTKVSGIPYLSNVSLVTGDNCWIGILYLLRCLNIPFNPKKVHNYLRNY